MPLEIVSRGPTSELDRKIAMLAEALGCKPEDIVAAATIDGLHFFPYSKLIDRLNVFLNLIQSSLHTPPD